MYAAELLIENPLLAYIISLGINTDFLCKLINIDGQYCFKPVQKFANLFSRRSISGRWWVYFAAIVKSL